MNECVELREIKPARIVTGFGGFWVRFVAWMVDGFIVFVCWIGTAGALMNLLIIWSKSTGNEEAAEVGGGFLSMGIWVVIVLLYFPGMESSQAQATIGKRAMGLRVTTRDGRRISFGRALCRFAAKLISGTICGIGYLMAGLTERKQALHDLLAGTLVVKSRLKPVYAAPLLREQHGVVRDVGEH